MKKRKLGNLETSELGFGCMGLNYHRGPAKDPKEMIKVVHAAIEAGITMFDTAECYQGVSETGEILYNEDLVGQALSIYPRDSYQIATKCGIKVIDGKQVLDARPEVIRTSLSESLKRLKTDYVDLYYLHRVDPKTPIELVAQTMKELMAEGKIKHWGLSEAGVETIRKAHAICPLTVVESEYSMIFREPEKNGLLDTLKELKIGFIPFAPLGKGFLTATIDPNQTFSKNENMAINQVLVELIKKLAKEKQVTPAQIALAWVMAQGDWIVPIPGSRKLSRIEENIKASKVILDEVDLKNIKRALDNMDLKAERWDPNSDNAKRVGK